jgi:cell division protein FtsB
MTKRMALIILGIVVLFGTTYLISNDKGVNKYFKLKKEVDSLNTVVKTLEQENQQLKDSYNSLVNHNEYRIEKIAREKYNFKRAGETVITIEEK